MLWEKIPQKIWLKWEEILMEKGGLEERIVRSTVSKIRGDPKLISGKVDENTENDLIMVIEEVMESNNLVGQGIKNKEIEKEIKEEMVNYWKENKPKL